MSTDQRRWWIAFSAAGIACLGSGSWLAFFRGEPDTPDTQNLSDEQAQVVPLPLLVTLAFLLALAGG